MAITRNRMASQHAFSMIPRSDIPRSRYLLPQKWTGSLNASQLVPIYCEEMLPGDDFDGQVDIFARLATPIVPVLDNAELETFFFFVPNRLGWENWEDFISGIGSYVVPVVQSATGFAALSIYDYLGIPTTDTTGLTQLEINALPLRAYNRIYNEWFRDQNLAPELVMNIDDGPDAPTDYLLRRRMKKHDYFTAALPWPQKGTAVELPLGTSAPVMTSATNLVTGAQNPMQILATDGSGVAAGYLLGNSLAQPGKVASAFGTSHTFDEQVYPSNLYADLNSATAATINAIRVAFQVQRMLEKDARGGSRYIEQIQVHFGVRPPDYRLQRPEYIGGGRSMVNTHPVAQTSETGSETPQGNLAAFTTVIGQGHRFKYAAQEHGYIIGIVNVRTDLTYQQGLRRHWSRQTRYDYYFPTLAHLGEQAILNKEIYLSGNDTVDNEAFGYQERHAEYRYTPNQITGLFRSDHPQSIDIWHYSEAFGSTPTLAFAFLEDPSYETLGRSLAVGTTAAAGQQILLDALFKVYATRPMPTYAVPGLIDHF